MVANGENRQIPMQTSEFKYTFPAQSRSRLIRRRGFAAWCEAVAPPRRKFGFLILGLRPLATVTPILIFTVGDKHRILLPVRVF